MTKTEILHEMANRPSEGRMIELLHALWRCDHPLPIGLEDVETRSSSPTYTAPAQVITKPLDAPSRRRGRQ